MQILINYLAFVLKNLNVLEKFIKAISKAFSSNQDHLDLLHFQFIPESLLNIIYAFIGVIKEYLFLSIEVLM